MDSEQKLISLYQKIYEHTEPECRLTCAVPQSCCSPEYCDEAERYAKERWNVELERTEHPRLPFMSPTGCVVAPHLRPMCTLHTCQVNGLGFKPGDPAWTKKYFKLRVQIEKLEMSK